MSETVTSYQDLITFSTHTGPGGQRMAQITLPDNFGAIPIDQLDRMCIEWIRHRICSAISQTRVGNQPKG